MNVNRIIKWAAGAVLAVGSVPAIGLARTHVSLPSASPITVTPTGMDRPAAATPVSMTSSRKAASTHKRASAKHRKASSRHKAAKHGHKARRAHRTSRAHRAGAQHKSASHA